MNCGANHQRLTGLMQIHILIMVFFLTMGMSTCTVPRQLLPPMSRLEAEMFSRKCAWMMPECLAWNLKCESPSGVDLICRASERCGNGGRKNRPMWSFRQGCDEECEHVFFPKKVYMWAQKRTKKSMNEHEWAWMSNTNWRDWFFKLK